MANVVKYSKKLAQEYCDLFETAQILPEKKTLVENAVNRAVKLKPKYQSVIGRIGVGIPWYALAGIHCLENNFRLDCHIHNGDPLSGKTTHVPKGRPRSGNPPYTWEESTLDALTHAGWDKEPLWTLPRMLWQWECYNGLAYRKYHAEVLSPYLWSTTQHYRKGKYRGDGDWDPSLVSEQVGTAALLRRMLERGIIASSDLGLNADFSMAKEAPLIHYSSTVIPYGEILQTHLNQFPGILLKVDGWTGTKTSAAFCSVYGNFLSGDPRILTDSPDNYKQSAFPGMPVRFTTVSGSQYVTLTQAYLNRFPHIWLSVDGWAGRSTADAFLGIHGVSLLGDPDAS